MSRPKKKKPLFLLPCPFCGSIPKTPEHYKRMGTSFDVFCIGCCDVVIERDTLMQAVEAWNTRHGDSQHHSQHR